MTPGGRWWQGPPPSIIFPMTIVSQVCVLPTVCRLETGLSLCAAAPLSCCLAQHSIVRLAVPPSDDPQCKGFGSKCIVDLNGAPNPLFLVGMNAILSGEACWASLGASKMEGRPGRPSGRQRCVDGHMRPPTPVRLTP